MRVFWEEKRWRFGVREQMLLAVLFLVIVPLISVGMWVNYRVSQTLYTQAVRENDQVSVNGSLLIDKLLAKHRETLAAVATEGDWADPEARQAHLKSLQQTTNGWSQVEYWSTQSGELLAAIPGEAPVTNNIQQKNWFRKSITQSGVVVENLSDAKSPMTDGLLFATAVRDSSGRINGVLVARLSLETFRNELKNTLFMPSETRVWIVTPDNHFALEPQAFPGEPEQYSSEFLRALEQDHLVSEKALPSTGWNLIVARNHQVALYEAGQITREIAYITGVILMVALFLAFWYIGAFLYPVRKMMEQIRALSEGYNVRDLAPMPERKDEVGETARAFQAMAGQLQEMSRDIVLALVAALETRDAYTKHHSERVAVYSRLIAEEMKLDPLQRENIVNAGVLHDIGKIGIPEGILTKPGALTGEERLEMQNHPQYSYDILQEVPAYTRAGIAEAVRQHHERWDGHGYPTGLIGEEICVEAQILAVADAFDAMTSNRVYRRALSLEQALGEVERGIGNQFAPEPAKAFLRVPISCLQDCLGEPPSQLECAVAEVS